MMLTTAQLDVTILALREFTTRYSDPNNPNMPLPEYDHLSNDLFDARETLNTLLTIRNRNANTAPHNPA